MNPTKPVRPYLLYPIEPHHDFRDRHIDTRKIPNVFGSIDPVYDRRACKNPEEFTAERKKYFTYVDPCYAEFEFGALPQALYRFGAELVSGRVKPHRYRFSWRAKPRDINQEQDIYVLTPDFSAATAWRLVWYMMQEITIRGKEHIYDFKSTPNCHYKWFAQTREIKSMWSRTSECGFFDLENLFWVVDRKDVFVALGKLYGIEGLDSLKPERNIDINNHNCLLMGGRPDRFELITNASEITSPVQHTADDSEE